MDLIDSFVRNSFSQSFKHSFVNSFARSLIHTSVKTVAQEPSSTSIHRPLRDQLHCTSRHEACERASGAGDTKPSRNICSKEIPPSPAVQHPLHTSTDVGAERKKLSWRLLHMRSLHDGQAKKGAQQSALRSVPNYWKKPPKSQRQIYIAARLQSKGKNSLGAKAVS